MIILRCAKKMCIRDSRFIDQLHAAGQTYWQVLPIGPTGFVNSPYQSYSAFAGNPYFIDLDRLAEQGLLTQNDILKFDWGENRSCISYDKIAEHRPQHLRINLDLISSFILTSVSYTHLAPAINSLIFIACLLSQNKRSGTVPCTAPFLPLR